MVIIPISSSGGSRVQYLPTDRFFRMKFLLVSPGKASTLKHTTTVIHNAYNAISHQRYITFATDSASLNHVIK